MNSIFATNMPKKMAQSHAAARAHASLCANGGLHAISLGFTKAETSMRGQALQDQASAYMIRVREDDDREAFRALFESEAPRLKGMLLKRGLDASAAEDVLQDAFIRIWRFRQSFDPRRARFGAWSYGIVRNAMIDHLRKAPYPSIDPIMLENIPEEETESAQFALAQEAEALRAAVDQLKPAQRDMVMRAFFDEQTHSEIAKETKLPLGTIKSRIRLALEKLRYELEKGNHGKN